MPVGRQDRPSLRPIGSFRTSRKEALAPSAYASDAKAGEGSVRCNQGLVDGGVVMGQGDEGRFEL